MANKAFFFVLIVANFQLHGSEQKTAIETRQAQGHRTLGEMLAALPAPQQLQALQAMGHLPQPAVAPVVQAPALQDDSKTAPAAPANPAQPDASRAPANN